MAESSGRKTLEERAQMSDIDRLRHSCAHVLATAILRIWPDAQFAAGPPIDGGFYYDLEMDHRLTPEDFEKIEAEMKKIAKENQSFEKIEVSRDEAMKMAQAGRLGGLSDRDVPSKFKVDILENIPEDEEISLFQNGDFIDLCAGPHVPRTGNCKAVKLLNIAGTFYKGDSSNPQLQRIYGTAFKNKTQLNEHLERLEEARKRDHRKLGRELGLFHIDEAVGQGLILWTPKGAVIRQELQNFISEELHEQGYDQVFTPHIGKLDLYRTSGHFPYYSDSQYPPIIERDALQALADEGCGCGEILNRLESTGDSEEVIDGFLLKPMNCPHHIKIFDSQQHSYRDLPVRLAEFGTVYRWEQSGELGGMTRVRGFTQDDAHLFCTEDQVADEVIGCLGLVKKVLNTLNMQDYRVRVGLRDPDSSKYVGDSAQWDRAEDALRKAAGTLDVEFSEEPGEAAFYGPKIDFVVKDVIGREWQLGTVQVDYNLPERFNLSYTGSDNKQHRPVMIHRAPFGSMERFIGCLIEHFAGHFPTWISPEQVRILPISEKYNDYAREVEQELKTTCAKLRVKVDDNDDKVGAKIRLAQVDKVPYMLVVGVKESESRSLSVRHRNRGDLGNLSVEEFAVQLRDEITSRAV